MKVLYSDHCTESRSNVARSNDSFIFIANGLEQIFGKKLES